MRRQITELPRLEMDMLSPVVYYVSPFVQLELYVVWRHLKQEKTWISEIREG